MSEKQRAAMQAALEALCTCTQQQREAATKLRAALAEREDAEPVAWLDPEFDLAYTDGDWNEAKEGGFLPLYTYPPRRPWISLTDNEIDEITTSEWGRYGEHLAAHRAYARRIEAALKAGNE